MNRKLSFEEFFQELNRSESHKGDSPAPEESEDLEIILAMEKLLAIEPSCIPKPGLRKQRNV
jgi:hypothetical protein